LRGRPALRVSADEKGRGQRLKEIIAKCGVTFPVI
jgi:hypothetical protein